MVTKRQGQDLNQVLLNPKSMKRIEPRITKSSGTGWTFAEGTHLKSPRSSWHVVPTVQSQQSVFPHGHPLRHSVVLPALPPLWTLLSKDHTGPPALDRDKADILSEHLP